MPPVYYFGIFIGMLSIRITDYVLDVVDRELDRIDEENNQ